MDEYKAEVILSTTQVKEIDEKILSGIREYNSPIFGYFDPQPFTVYSQNENGEIIAGASCDIIMKKVLRIHYLWVSDEYRKQGLGTKIINKIEELAKEKGCKNIHLDTFEFQAPRFYEKNGFKCIGTIPGWLEGQDYIFYRKRVG
jgi:GNAT superfamily N-acetyltransferase